jgi:hypothetical protein
MGYEELAHLGMVEFHEASMRMGEERGEKRGEKRGENQPFQHRSPSSEQRRQRSRLLP